MSGVLTIAQFASLGAALAVAYWLMTPKEGAAMKGGRARHLISLLAQPGVAVVLMGMAIAAVKSAALEFDDETWVTVISAVVVAGAYALIARTLPVVGPLIRDRELAVRQVRERATEDAR